MFKAFVDDCRNAGTRIVIISSPRYIIFHEKEESNAMIDQIAREKKVDYLDFVNDTTFTNHREYFDDDAHLNYRGAEFFTNTVLNRLDSLKPLQQNR
jgi:lysophospholipase L1-like esterase